MNKKGKKIIEGLLSFAVGFSITTVMQHWFMSNLPDGYLTLFDSIMIPLTTVGSYSTLQELKQYIRATYPDVMEVLSPFLDFEEKKKKNNQNKKKNNKKVNKNKSVQPTTSKHQQTKNNKKKTVNNKMPEVPTNYFDKLLKKSGETQIYYSDNNMTKINQFLNFIEYNYYQNQENKSKYIDALISQIYLYSEQENIASFSETDVNNIINNCYFMPADLKEQIKREYKYCLLEKVKLSYKNYKENLETFSDYTPFTIYQEEYYEYILQRLLDEEILKDFKEPEKALKISCDINFVAETVQTIFHEYGYEIVGNDDIGKQMAIFTSNLIFNAGIEAIKDNSYIISSKAILSGIKSSDYFTDDQKENISKIMLKRMYGVTNNTVKEVPKVNLKKGNIIQFPGSKEEV